MIHEVIVPDVYEITRLSGSLARIASSGSTKDCSTLLDAYRNDMVLFEEGKPVIRYRPAEEQDPGATISRYIDTFSDKPHVVGLFGNNIEFSREFEFRYMTRGLSKGETCVNIYPDEPRFLGTEKEARDEFDSYLKSKFSLKDKQVRTKLLERFSVYNCADALTDMDGPKSAVWKIIRESTKRAGKPPYRLVIHVYGTIKTDEDVRAHVAIESSVHESFEKVGGTALCPHYKRVVTLQDDKYALWMREMMRSHHIAFSTLDRHTEKMQFA